MAVMKICKVCGKEYEYCKSEANGHFIWRDVACCPEHASEYFKQVAIARGEIEDEPVEAPKKSRKKKTEVVKEPIVVEAPEKDIVEAPAAEDVIEELPFEIDDTEM